MLRAVQANLKPSSGLPTVTAAAAADANTAVTAYAKTTEVTCQKQDLAMSRYAAAMVASSMDLDIATSAWPGYSFPMRLCARLRLLA